MDLLMSALVFVLVFMVSGNNLSASSGSIISSRMVSRRIGIAISIVGTLAGLFMEGNLLKYGFGQIFESSPHSLVMIPLITGILIFMIANKMRVPQSLSITFTTSLMGIGFAFGNGIDTGFALSIIAFWVFAAAVSIALTIASMRISSRIIAGRDVWGSLRRIKQLLILLSFLTAFTLGANTFGLVMVSVSRYVSVFVIAVAIIFGSVFASAGTLRRVSDDILPMRYLNALVSQAISVLVVEAGTLFSVPISNTQTYSASLYGATLSYGSKLFRRRPAIEMAFTWVITAVISFGAGYAITKLLLS